MEPKAKAREAWTRKPSGGETGHDPPRRQAHPEPESYRPHHEAEAQVEAKAAQGQDERETAQRLDQGGNRRLSRP